MHPGSVIDSPGHVHFLEPVTVTLRDLEVSVTHSGSAIDNPAGITGSVEMRALLLPDGGTVQWP